MARWENATRWYEAQIQRDLFGDYTITCSWGGKYSKNNGHKIYVVDDESAALNFVESLDVTRSKSKPPYHRMYASNASPDPMKKNPQEQEELDEKDNDASFTIENESFADDFEAVDELPTEEPFAIEDTDISDFSIEESDAFYDGDNNDFPVEAEVDESENIPFRSAPRRKKKRPSF